MSQPLFPEVDILLDLIMAEIPSGVYAEDLANDPNPNNRSVSSSEFRANAVMIANLYSNMSDINDDKNINSVTSDGLPFWEKDLFSSIQNSSLGRLQRIQNLLVKFQSDTGISLPAIQGVIASILDPLGLPFQILPYSGQSNGTMTGAWILEVTPLEFGSYLASLDPLFGAQQDMTPLDCNLDYAAAGITAEDLADIQATAYTYEVQIYGNAGADTLAYLDKILAQDEPARSTHIITNNATMNPEDESVEGWTPTYLYWWTT